MFANLSPYLSPASYVRTGPWTLDPAGRPAEYYLMGPVGLDALYPREPGVFNYHPAWLVLEEADAGPPETSWVPSQDPRGAAAQRAKRNAPRPAPRPCGKGKPWTRETPLREALAFC